MHRDRLGRFRTVVWRALLLGLCLGLTAASAADPPDFVPFGAYLSWERLPALARYHGVDRWVDVSRRLNAIRANHVNLLWVTNMAEADLPRLLEECEKRDIKLLPSMSTIEAKIDWRWVNQGAYYDKVLPRVVEAAGGSDTLIGWVLSDEPRIEHLPRLETLRLRLGELDPNRFCTSVTMWGQTPQVPKQTGLPVVCVDLYPFFGPNDPNGPHTDAASKGYFRKHTAKMIEAIGESDTVGWVMGMCFSDVWGPRKYDERGHLIGLPGAYLHWRCPTPAEMRWQVWETFRSGAKGFICYTLAPEVPNPENRKLPPADVAWKDVLAREDTDMGPNALTNPDASATEQLEELGRVYARIEPHAGLIRRSRIAKEPLLETPGIGQSQTFVDTETGKTFAIVLNDDLHQRRTVAVRVRTTSMSIVDLTQNRKILLESSSTAGVATGQISLKAGDGAILAFE